ncbi:hypothetical protein HPB51_021030 [Rhipicephalus microplus]|uniref:Ran gtpase-activating protein n=1 Tax=Rhipicephalus microplus TaxID=6941 RepID=A0A9J6DC17_RHIMP|nr:hypothetical protein HPB51_021030 [Rhipicephalus microplus]
MKLQANGAVAIAAALAENTTLVSLRIASNSIGPMGARALAETLKTNSSLSVLDLRDAIGTSGAVAFATTLKMNCKLEELHVCGNVISEEGIVAIAEAVMDNKSLKIRCSPTDSLRRSAEAPRCIRRSPHGQHCHPRCSAVRVGHARQEAAVAHAAAHSDSEHLCVYTCGPEIEQLCAALAQNKSTQEVEINCYLNLDDGTALAHLFKTTTTI